MTARHVELATTHASEEDKRRTPTALSGVRLSQAQVAPICTTAPTCHLKVAKLAVLRLTCAFTFRLDWEQDVVMSLESLMGSSPYRN